MPVRRVAVTDAERVAAYEAAIHDLVGTMATIRQVAENAVNGVGGSSNEERLQRIIGYATGRLTRVSESLEPVYRGYRKARDGE